MKIHCSFSYMQVTICPDEAARRERTELHEELNAIRWSSNRCTDAVRLAELKAGMKALHDQFRTDINKQRSPSVTSHTQTLEHNEGGTDTTVLRPTKTARTDYLDHAYLTLQD